MQYTSDILDYQVHLALEPLEPNEMPDQIESEVTFPNSVSYFTGTLLNMFSRGLCYLAPLLKIFLALIPAKHTLQHFYRYTIHMFTTPPNI